MVMNYFLVFFFYFRSCWFSSLILFSFILHHRLLDSLYNCLSVVFILVLLLLLLNFYMQTKLNWHYSVGFECNFYRMVSYYINAEYYSIKILPYKRSAVSNRIAVVGVRRWSVHDYICGRRFRQGLSRNTAHNLTKRI